MIAKADCILVSVWCLNSPIVCALSIRKVFWCTYSIQGWLAGEGSSESIERHSHRKSTGAKLGYAQWRAVAPTRNAS
jgi:hypothetical protein